MERHRHYLDHAATSWPKPSGSLEAAMEYQRNIGVASGRGAYASAHHAMKLVDQTRVEIAKLINASRSDEIYFTSNGTHSLNVAMLGLLGGVHRNAAHVVTTATEHNSVLRPLWLVGQRNGIEHTIVPCDQEGYVDPLKIRDAITPKTRLVIINHVSNVTGAIQDIRTIATLCKEQNVVVMLDAAQSIGYLPIDVQRDSIDILAAPGHKGCGGLLGTGILYVKSSIAEQLEPVWAGGTGTMSDTVDGPFTWSSMVESGNSNMPGIASLNAGIQFLNKMLHLSSETPPDNLSESMAWTERILQAIDSQSNLRLVGPRSLDRRLPVISLVSRNVSCHEMAMLIDTALGIEARSGLHCAGLIHEHIGTASCSGTLRLSLGHTSTADDIDAAVEGIRLVGSL